jgi:hypothetical protein
MKTLETNISTTNTDNYDLEYFYSRKQKTENRREIPIYHWCTRVRIMHLYDKTIINCWGDPGITSTKSKTHVINKDSKHEGFKRHITGAHKLDYNLVRKGKNKKDHINIKIESERNIFHSCLLGCGGCLRLALQGSGGSTPVYFSGGDC